MGKGQEEQEELGTLGTPGLSSGEVIAAHAKDLAGVLWDHL